MFPAISVNKECCLPMPSATAASPMGRAPCGQFKMKRNRIVALDKKRYDLRNYFNEARLLHFPIHRKVLKSLLKMSGFFFFFFMISSNLLMYYMYFFQQKLLCILAPPYLFLRVSQLY